MDETTHHSKNCGQYVRNQFFSTKFFLSILFFVHLFFVPICISAQSGVTSSCIKIITICNNITNIVWSTKYLVLRTLSSYLQLTMHTQFFHFILINIFIPFIDSTGTIYSSKNNHHIRVVIMEPLTIAGYMGKDTE